MEDYFDFYWANDRLYCLSADSDMRNFEELDNNIKNEIFKNFLFRPFISIFHNMFELRKSNDPRIKHSYYKWLDDEYSDFMIMIMKCLKPRRYLGGSVIYEELEEVLEITFVMSGTFHCGYEINKIKKLKIQLPPGMSFGGFNCCFLKRSMFIYKCKKEMRGYALQRKDWK